MIAEMTGLLGMPERPEQKKCDLLKTLPGQFQEASSTDLAISGSVTPSLQTFVACS